MDNPFKYTNSIFNKNYLVFSEEDEKDYNSFLTNRCLSYHLDCILHVEEIAKRPDMPSKWAYEYYFNSIRQMRRQFSKWPKKEKDEITQMLMEYYQVNRYKAEEYQKILSAKQIARIKEDMEKGGY